MDTIEDLRGAADRIIALHEDGEFEAALELADEVVTVAAAAHERRRDDPIARESLFVARFERALLLAQSGRYVEAAGAFAEAADTPIDPEDPDQRHEVAMALLHQGMCHDQAGQIDEAIGAYETVIEGFALAGDAVTRDQVVRARANRAAALLMRGDLEAATAAAHELRQDLDPAAPLDAEQWVLAARIEAAALSRAGDVEQARDRLQATRQVTADAPEVVEQRELAEAELAELD